MTQNTEVIERKPVEIVNRSEAVIMLAPLLEGIPRVDEGDGEAILKRILLATTIGDVFATPGTDQLEKYLDVPLRILAIRWDDSDYENGTGIYLVVEAQKADGEKVVFNTGAATPVVQLCRAHAMGAIPGLEVVPRKAKKPTKRGYYPFNLELCGD